VSELTAELDPLRTLIALRGMTDSLRIALVDADDRPGGWREAIALDPGGRERILRQAAGIAQLAHHLEGLLDRAPIADLEARLVHDRAELEALQRILAERKQLVA